MAPTPAPRVPYEDPACPDYASSDWRAQISYWRMVDDILAGPRRIRDRGEEYLPRFEGEEQKEYEARLKMSPWTPLYKDSQRQLTSKPFGREVRLATGSPPAVLQLVEDIDSAGTHLHVFAREVFKNAVNRGIDWIYVDYTQVPVGATLADERQAGARPYWTRIPAHHMLAVYDAKVDGRMQFVHARFEEYSKRQSGYDEVVVRRIRILDRAPVVSDDSQDVVGWGPATFEVWEETEEIGVGGEAIPWRLVDSGPITTGIIMLVPVVTGERDIGSWRVEPPLAELADMQITLYQMESNRSRVQTMSAFPVAVLRGVEKPKDGRQTLGPRTIIYIPPAPTNGQLGDFNFREPTGAAAEQLRDDVREQKQEMREAGMQPMTPASGVVTATAIAVASAKAHSSVEAWAIALKDALEQAWVYTCMWLGVPEEKAPAVEMKTNFTAGKEGADEMTVIDGMQTRGLISREQEIDEAVRRGILGPNYDYAEDQRRIAAEALLQTESEDDLASEDDTGDLADSAVLAG